MLRNLKKRFTSPNKLRGEQQASVVSSPPQAAAAAQQQEQQQQHAHDAASAAAPAAVTPAADATPPGAASTGALAALKEAVGARGPCLAASYDGAKEQRDAAYAEQQPSSSRVLAEGGGKLSAPTAAAHAARGESARERAGAAHDDATHKSGRKLPAHGAHGVGSTSALAARLLALQRCHASTLGLAAVVRDAAAALEALEPAARLLSRVESQCGRPTLT
jgi:hypothetical protein